MSRRVRLLSVVLVAALSALAAARFFRNEPVSVPSVTSASDARQRAVLEENAGQPSDPALLALFEDINRRHFGGSLRPTTVRWDRALDDVGALAGRTFTLEGMYGRIGENEIILLNPRMIEDAAAIGRALSHEMVHAYLALLGESSTRHDARFQTELRRLAAEGAFEGIAATDEEKAALRSWLDAEGRRLELDQRQVEADGADIDADRALFERDLADLNARASRSRPSPSELAAITERGDAINRRVVAINERIARGRAALAHLNAEIARYNLMAVYPDGLDEGDLLMAPITPAQPQP